MELSRKQTVRGAARFLLITDPDPKTAVPRGLVADPETQALERVRDARPLLRSPAWKPLLPGDPTLDDLTRRLPALRRHRGIEVRLGGGRSAWVLWRRWTSADPALQAALTALTESVAIPAFEPDGDWFLAGFAARALGGEVQDPPRSAVNLGADAY